MENAADALKIAFAVLVFAMAITMTFMSISQAKATADAVISMTDKTNYYDYYEGTDENIVGIDTLISTLYRYHKESFWVTIKEENNIIVDFNLENDNGTPWSGNQENIEKTIDWFINGLSTGSQINGQDIIINSTLERGEKNSLGKYSIAKKSLQEIDLSSKKIYETFDEFNYSGQYLTDPVTKEKIIIKAGYKRIHITYTIKN